MSEYQTAQQAANVAQGTGAHWGFGAKDNRPWASAWDTSSVAVYKRNYHGPVPERFLDCQMVLGSGLRAIVPRPIMADSLSIVAAFYRERTERQPAQDLEYALCLCGAESADPVGERRIFHEWRLVETHELRFLPERVHPFGRDLGLHVGIEKRALVLHVNQENKRVWGMNVAPFEVRAYAQDEDDRHLDLDVTELHLPAAFTDQDLKLARRNEGGRGLTVRVSGVELQSGRFGHYAPASPLCYWDP